MQVLWRESGSLTVLGEGPSGRGLRCSPRCPVPSRSLFLGWRASCKLLVFLRSRLPAGVEGGRGSPELPQGALTRPSAGRSPSRGGPHQALDVFPLPAGGRDRVKVAPRLFHFPLARFSESFNDNLASKLGIFEIHMEFKKQWTIRAVARALFPLRTGSPKPEHPFTQPRGGCWASLALSPGAPRAQRHPVSVWLGCGREGLDARALLTILFPSPCSQGARGNDGQPGPAGPPVSWFHPRRLVLEAHAAAQ